MTRLTVKTVPAFGFQHWTGKVTLPEIPKVAGAAIDSLIHAAGDNGRPVTGPAIVPDNRTELQLGNA
jgi:hypothetical protein